MARGARNIDIEDESPDYSVLGRHLLWAGIAAVALGVAALAAQSQTGTQRLAVISGRDPGAMAQHPPAPSRQAEPAARPAEPDAETRRLAEAVRQLAADRDRLLGRIEALERNLDVTGSIPRDDGAMRDNAARESAAAAPPSAAPTLPPGWSLVPNTIPPAAGVPAIPAPNANALPGGSAGQALATAPGVAATSGLSGSEQAAGSVATKTEFGVDIGGGPTFDGVRALWTSVRTAHPALFDGLRPVVAVREGGKSGGLELRLVVGPLSNAGAAARLCASLMAAGLACQPAVFDGQRFALR
ncbi:MAG TPA: hypothetical protein VKE26_12535 [Xanthobacteraceae bacterium]|nr:hypothetical protein [Xanthobacteraceae bacterium]